MSAQTGKRKVPPGARAPINVAAGPMSAEMAGQPGGAPSTSKRTRFDIDPENVGEGEGDLDIQEQDRKRLQQGRRGRVNTDGYDSDSSIEGGDEDADDEDAVAPGEDGKRDGENGKIAGVDEDDEDMFNMEDDGKEGGGTDGKVKPKKFLELKDIEGQEFDEDGNVEDDGDPELELESDEDAEGDDGQKPETNKDNLHDPDAVVVPMAKKGKKTTKGGEDMGFELDSFNVKSEMATGRFDAEGNYIETTAKDPHAEHDQWLKGHYSRKSIKAAREAQDKRDKEARAQEQAKEEEFFDEDECKMRLASLMRRSETVLRTLQRLGAEAKKAGVSGSSSTKQWKKSAKQNPDVAASTNGKGKETAQDGALSEEANKIKEDLDAVTSLSSELMSRHGMTGVYDATYETLARDVRRSGLVRATWDPAAAHDSPRIGESAQSAAATQYVYRWSPDYLAAMASTGTDRDAQSRQIFGPFGPSDLQAWRSAGYFGDSGERVLLRPEGEDAGPWRAWSDIFG